MRSFEVHWLRAILRAIFPAAPDLGLDVSAGDLDVGAFYGDLRRRVPGLTALGLRLALWCVALAPLFVLRRFATVAGLLPEERQRLLTRLAESPAYGVRQLALVFKATGALLYGAHPMVRAVMAPSSPAPLRSGPRLAHDAPTTPLVPVTALRAAARGRGGRRGGEP